MTTEPDDPTSAATESLICRLGAEKGWTPEEVHYVLRHVKAPLEGFRSSIVSAEMMLRIADEELLLAQQAMYKNPGAGTPTLHPSFKNFDPDDKEGELRRRWADRRRTNYRMALESSRRAFMHATQFQAVMNATIPPPAPLIEDEDEDEDMRREREREEEVSKRLEAMARSKWEGTPKREKKALRTKAKHGLGWVETRAVDMGEALPEVPTE